MPPGLTHSFQCWPTGEDNSSISCISKDLRPKGAEDIDKDSAEETGYWKKLEVAPCDVDSFHHLSSSRH